MEGIEFFSEICLLYILSKQIEKNLCKMTTDRTINTYQIGKINV